MDWYLDASDGTARRDLRHELRELLRRHADSAAGVDDAELIFEELVGNAARHAAGPVWVSLRWNDVQPELVVRDLGPGFDPSVLEAGLASRVLGPVYDAEDPPTDDALSDLPEGGRGLFLVSHLSAQLAARARTSRGMSVSAVLPVKRTTTLDQDPPRRRAGALPRLEEARPEGAFGRESFLRALVVQLAHAVETQHGPDAAEAAVAQVGADVGGQMEEEFRRAAGVVGRMSPAQVGECLVRLKHAIEGDFSVVEADEHHIVLVNTQCPFGESVRSAPSLCRMTSSVFGGIAARNGAGAAGVLLEERIALGDPTCRVTVWLQEPPEHVRPYVHVYRRPV